MYKQAFLTAGALFLVAGAVRAQAAPLHCSRTSDGVSVPAGFCIKVYAKNAGPLRHLAVAHDGTVYAALSSRHKGGGIAMFRDTNSDGHADTVHYFGDVTGTGVALHDGYLYFAETTRILRYKLSPKTGLPDGKPQTVVSGLPGQREHSARSMAFDGKGHLFVNVGAPSNACQKQDRQPHSVGIDPCPLLKDHGGIWRFAANKINQHFSAGDRYATGLRNTIALAWNLKAEALYGVMMGRDQLHGNWPKLFTAKQSAELPAEEMVKIVKGGNYGWPYCYYDGMQNKLVLAPEYGGNGKKVGRCDRYIAPVVAFPAHWAPEAMVFYAAKAFDAAKAFPGKYRGGAFIAFHGSWNRAPLPQQGYVVAFVPFTNGKPSGHWQVFARGFAGKKHVASPGDARFRPVGIAVGPDGALYVADSRKGMIWRIYQSVTQ